MAAGRRRRRRLGRVPAGSRAPLPGGPARLLRRAVVPPRRGRRARRRHRAGRPGRGERRAAGWRRPPRCSPGTSADRPSASRCCTSPSSTTGWRRRPCGPSSTRRCGTARWPVKSWQAYLGRPVRRRRRARLRGTGPGVRPLGPAARPTSRRPRTTRCATRGSSTPCGCSRPACRWSCTSSPAPSTARRW